jgi:hypothetical protein
MTPLGTRSVYKGNYLSQIWTPVLKGASGRTHPLFNGCSDIYVIMPKFNEQVNLEIFEYN